MDTLSFNSCVAICGVVDISAVTAHKDIKIVTWTSNISALILGADYQDRWKYKNAIKLGIPCIPVSAFRPANIQNGYVLNSENDLSELWTTKYAPKKITDVIGHTSQIHDLIKWLREWRRGSGGALVTGPPGIGKTTVVHMVIRGCGYEVVEFNASNERSASAVRKMFEEASRSNHIGRKRVIVMDEVDGMSSGDRGGVGELAKIIRITTFPIICIANERGSPKIRPITSSCVDIRFNRPTKIQITKSLMTSVVAKEGINITAGGLELMCERNGNDIRSLLNFLQFNSAAGSIGGAKDELQRVDAFSATGRLFGGGGTVIDREALVFVDHGMVPLMVAEAYISASQRPRSRCDECAQLENCSRAADYICTGDVIDRRIRGSQNWGLLPAAVQCTVAAAAAVGGPSPFNVFPQWLGKNSKRLKHRRSYTSMSTRSRINGFYESVDLLRALLFRGNATAIVSRLQELKLTRDDMLDTLVDTVFTDYDASVALDTKTKGAISREWKKRTDYIAATSVAADCTTVEETAVDDSDDDDCYQL